MNDCLFNCKLILTDDTIKNFFNVDFDFVICLFSRYERILHSFTIEFSQFAGWGFYVILLRW